MPRLVVLMVLTLAACGPADIAPNQASAPVPIEGWRTEHGRAPTQAEFSALAATCEAKAAPLDTCLTEMGLRRSP